MLRHRNKAGGAHVPVDFPLDIEAAGNAISSRQLLAGWVYTRAHLAVFGSPHVDVEKLYERFVSDGLAKGRDLVTPETQAIREEVDKQRWQDFKRYDDALRRAGFAARCAVMAAAVQMVRPADINALRAGLDALAAEHQRALRERRELADERLAS